MNYYPASKWCRITTEVSGLSSRTALTASYTYTNDQNLYLDGLTYGDGDTVDYEYDDQGRVTLETFEDGSTVSYEYDNTGALDRLALKETRASGVLSLAVRYQYDEENQLIGKTVFSDGQSPVHTAYAYDHLHNISEISSEDVFQKISYSSHGLLEQTTTGYISGGADHTVKQETYVYGTADTSLHQYTVTYGGKTNTDTYTYDGRGNITQITRKVGSTEYIIKYTYDAANQLIREDNQQAGYTWVMTYDDAGNMLTRKKYSYTTGTLGSVLSTQTLTYGDSTWGDLLTGINGTTVTSDVIGNVLNDGTWTYTWKNGRQLATMSKSGVTWSFAYDASGMRTQRVSGSTTYTYTYDDSTLLKMTVGSNTLIFTYGANGHPMTVKYNGVDYYYVTNAQGDVIAIVNSAGAEAVTYTYDAWGNILSVAGSMASTLGAHNPLRYRSYVYDQETGLYYLQSRYYNPAICRFISSDNISYLGIDGTPLSYNLFAYCGNNPIMGYDPTGHFGFIGAIIAAGAIVGGLLGAFSAATTGGNILESAIEGCLTGALGATCGILISPPAVAIGLAGIGGAIIDFATQATTQYIETKRVDLTKIDRGRVAKTGAQTGIGTAIPVLGKGAGNAVDAFGTALIWAEAAVLITCTDVAITNIVAATQSSSRSVPGIWHSVPTRRQELQLRQE